VLSLGCNLSLGTHSDEEVYVGNTERWHAWNRIGTGYCTRKFVKLTLK
jgi:hypothetical protein